MIVERIDVMKPFEVHFGDEDVLAIITNLIRFIYTIAASEQTTMTSLSNIHVQPLFQGTSPPRSRWPHVRDTRSNPIRQDAPDRDDMPKWREEHVQDDVRYENFMWRVLRKDAKA